MLLHNSALLGLKVNPLDVYDPSDMDFLLALEIVTDRLYATRDEERRKQEDALRAA